MSEPEVTGDDWPTTLDGLVKWLELVVAGNAAMRDRMRDIEGGDSPECQYFQGRHDGFAVTLSRVKHMIESKGGLS